MLAVSYLNHHHCLHFAMHWPCDLIQLMQLLCELQQQFAFGNKLKLINHASKLLEVRHWIFIQDEPPCIGH